MTMQKTSIEAYHHIKPTLTGRRLEVFRVIYESGPICIEDAAKQMGTKDNCISGRFGELERDGWIVNTFQRKVTGSTSHILWRATTDREKREILKNNGRGQQELF